jgi:hypothetical protein
MVNIELKEVNPKDLEPNDWNPNVLSDLKYKSLKNSVKQFPEILQGQRIIVREHPKKKGKYQVLNGAHRLKIANELNFKTVPIGVIDEQDESKAKLISLALANVGEEDYDKKLDVIYDIQKDMSIAEIAELIGEDKNTLSTLVDEMAVSTESLAEIFEKEEYQTEVTSEEAKKSVFNMLELNEPDIDSKKTGTKDIPTFIKLPIASHIKKAIKRGYDEEYETIYSIIMAACKLFTEQDAIPDPKYVYVPAGFEKSVEE